MAEYINKSDAVRMLVQDYAYAAADMVKKIPTEDVAPVVHGRWVKEREIGNHFMGSGTSFHCSVCGRKAGHNQVKAYHYCPRCGAKMEEEPPK